ncbi:PREDICTED: uncharacterized protein LOC104818888 isoform X2 [Tarenaya hassleriana]|uniref:uncharacterized protein LOC104818888 isoform X2 n=1 Tax=Tarenaya hassleriana TaxID=28532 RepID=UPI00053C2ADC|nr:PREDICTED: uncharacterized protein LOC104818888 isoform X2 [Tarenaya hassleriana]
MERFEGSTLAIAGFSIRRKRSTVSRVPRVISGTSNCFTFLPSSTEVSTSLPFEENTAFRNVGHLSRHATVNKVKFKFKTDGAAREIKTNSMSDINGERPTCHSHGIQSAEFQDERQSSFPYKVEGNGLQQRHVQKTICLAEIHQFREKPSEIVNGTSMSKSVRKSKKGLKRRVLDEELDSDDGDEEIRYLEKLKSKRTSRVSEAEEEEEEEEHLSEDKFGTRKKKPIMCMVDSFPAGASGQTPTTRTRALQSGKDASSLPGSGLLEFPDGLPSAPSKRQRQKLSEMEQQSKKAEAAQRRRMQSEKAARDAEAEAIRKILGQDSGRKKREEKIRKQQEELARERAAKSNTVAANTIRWVTGPSGTTVTFSEDIGLPDIFRPVTFSYPPAREKCVGPNCTNAYKYRDSKSKLPLCSLHCYKAIQEKKMQPLITC